MIEFVMLIWGKNVLFLSQICRNSQNGYEKASRNVLEGFWKKKIAKLNSSTAINGFVDKSFYGNQWDWNVDNSQSSLEKVKIIVIFISYIL